MLDVIDGHIKEMFNKEEELFEFRMKICKECPLYKDTPLGPVCNPNLFINKEGEVSKTRKDGFVRGCSCRLGSKTRVSSAKCIVNKW